MLRFLLRGFLAAALCALVSPGSASAQMPSGLPAGPKVSIVAVTQPLPTQPQFTRVDVPYLRDMMKERSGGRIEATVSSHAERNLSGTELVRLVRSGQADIGASTLTTLSGDVPILDGVDLAGLAPGIGTARRIADAMMPVVNRDLERFGTRLVIIYPFPAQVVFCRQPFASLADLRGRKVRTFGNSLVDLVGALGAQPVSIGFPEVYSALAGCRIRVGCGAICARRASVRPPAFGVGGDSCRRARPRSTRWRRCGARGGGSGRSPWRS
jgi:TRAP-type transport system periplasmic protein